jgi:phosphohistidine phosphatase
VTECPDFYEQGSPEVIQRFRTVPSAVERVLAVGHEPTWSDIVEILTGANVRFPTAALARIDLDVVSWEAVSAGTGRLICLIPPRLLSPKAVRRSWSDPTGSTGH